MPSLRNSVVFTTCVALFSTLSVLITTVAAVNLTYYKPAAGVDPCFANWITGFYTAAEASNMTAAGYFEFFSANAVIDLGTFNPAQDVIDRLTIRVHYPQVTTASQASPSTTFDLFGLAKGYYKNGTCSASSYETKFTIQKTHGRANLKPKSGSLIGLLLVEQTALSKPCNSF